MIGILYDHDMSHPHVIQIGKYIPSQHRIIHIKNTYHFKSISDWVFYIKSLHHNDDNHNFEVYPFIPSSLYIHDKSLNDIIRIMNFHQMSAHNPS